MLDQDQLLREIRSGNRRAFERLVRHYQGLVHRMVGRLVDNPDDVRELCQETFLRVHASLSQFRGDSSLGTWIGRIAFTAAARHLRRKRIALVSMEDVAEESLSGLSLDGPSLTDSLGRQDVARCLHEAIAALPALQRCLITLYYFEELSVNDIGTITDLPAGTIKSYLFRARKSLRDALESQLGDET